MRARHVLAASAAVASGLVLTMRVVENGNRIVTAQTFLGSVTRVGVLLSGDVEVQIGKPSSEAAALSARAGRGGGAPAGRPGQGSGGHPAGIRSLRPLLEALARP